MDADAVVRRVTDLFVEGKEVVLRGPEDPEGPVVLWVNKLNPFERQEAIRDGQAARSRLILALKEVGSDEQVIFDADLARMSRAAIQDALLGLRAQDFLLGAVRDLRADPEWRERLLIVDRGGQDLPEEGTPEREYQDKVHQEYVEEVRSRATKARDEAESDLRALTDEQVAEKYRDEYLSLKGGEALEREFAKTQLYFAVRRCSATHDNGRWQHTDCDHTQRWLTDRSQVKSLPGGLIDLLNQAIRDLTLDHSDARFSAGQTTSSAPSRLPETVEESAPSTPEATSAEPVGTSS